MMNKILWIDTETTGINHHIHSIVEISMIVEINYEIVDKIQLYCQPFEPYEEIDTEILKVSNKTIEDLKNYPSIKETKIKINKFLDKYVDKFNNSDKFLVAGYRTSFDIDFLNSFFKRLNDIYLGSYINFNTIFDLYPIISFLNIFKKINVKNCKLKTICNYFGIQIETHDSFNDIMCTRELAKIVVPNLKWVYEKPKRSKRL